ncbi:MAG: ABC transporter permease [Acidobacteria bacterium]|nr:ABC transporter permease [Acidobacteriota bacterium]
MRMFWIRTAFLGGLMLVWEVATRPIGGTTVIDPYYISSPLRIWEYLVEGLSTGRLLYDTAVTVAEAALGLVIGIITGLAVGLAFAFSRSLAEFGEPFMRGLNALPRVALAPLMLLWFGIGFAGKVFIAWSLVFFIVFYNTYTGARSIDPGIVNAAKVLGASRLQMVRMVVLPGVFTWVFAALRVSVSFALLGAIVGEFVGARAGLGYQLMLAQGHLNTDGVFAVLVIIAVLAIVLIELAREVEERLLKWRPATSL